MKVSAVQRRAAVGKLIAFAIATLGLVMLLRQIWLAIAVRREQPDYLLCAGGALFLAGTLAAVFMHFRMNRLAAEEQMNAPLLESKQFIEKITEASPHIVYVFDIVKQRNIYANRQIAHDLGYSPEEIQAMGNQFLPKLLHPDDLGRLSQLLARWDTAEDGEIIETEYRMKHRGGEWHWLLGRDTVFLRDEHGKVQQIIGTAQDITQRKQEQLQIKHSEEQLRTSLAEKEALLQEVHHRVKNNLQIVMSLLNLQANQLDDPVVLNVFAETRNRVRSMSLLHEMLYQSSKFAQIDLRAYIDTLCVQLLRAFAADPCRISLQTNIDLTNLDIDRAIPCGLIVNELVSNALKYAFPDQRKGTISIDFSAASDDKFVLLISDDGVGLPEALDTESSNTLGLRLVKDLTKQLRGHVECDRSNGTSFRITF